MSAIMTQKKEVETIDDSLTAALLVITIASLMIMIVTVTVIGKVAVAVVVAVAAASCIGYSSVLRRHWVAMMKTATTTTTTTIEKSTPKRVDTIN